MQALDKLAALRVVIRPWIHLGSTNSRRFVRLFFYQASGKDTMVWVWHDIRLDRNKDETQDAHKSGYRRQRSAIPGLRFDGQIL